MDWKSLLEKNPTGLLQKLTTKQKDPVEQHRKAILKNIDRAKVAHEEGKKRSGIYKQVGNFHRVELKVGRKEARRTVPVEGKPFNMVPSESFPAFLNGFREHVASGQFDPNIRLATEGSISASGARKRRSETPEAKAARIAKAQATRAAKRGTATRSR